jgi:hypothetical protein
MTSIEEQVQLYIKQKERSRQRAKLYYEKHRNKAKPKMRDHARCRKAQRDANMMALKNCRRDLRCRTERTRPRPLARICPYIKYRVLDIHKQTMVHALRLLGKDWLANEHIKGALGVLRQLLGGEPQEEPIL